MFEEENKTHILTVAWIIFVSATAFYDFLAYFGIFRDSIHQIVVDIFLVFAFLDIIFIIGITFLFKLYIKTDKTMRILYIWVVNYSVGILGFIIAAFSGRFYYSLLFSLPALVLFVVYNPWHFENSDE